LKTPPKVFSKIINYSKEKTSGLDGSFGNLERTVDKHESFPVKGIETPHHLKFTEKNKYHYSPISRVSP